MASIKDKLKLRHIAQAIPKEKNQAIAISVRHRSCNFAVNWQDIRLWTNWRNLELVDLVVALGVMVLDVCELGGTAEGIVVPIEVTQPPEMLSAKPTEASVVL